MGKDCRELIKTNNMLTDFQKKVLLEILKIPKGEVRSYSYIASKIGSPKACRAVGQALNRNPYAPEVPCHRVISADGTIGGYARSINIKRGLLRSEGVNI